MNRAYDRQILRLAIPALGALLADPLVSLVDTAFVGRLGPTSLASLGIAVAIFSVGFWAFIFLTYGVTPLVSHALGEGDEAKASRIVGSGLVAALGLGTGVAVLLIVAAYPLAEMMGAQGVVLDQTVGYLRIRAMATPAVLTIMLGHGAFRGHHDTRTPLIVSAAFNVVNLVLDPVLIFGLGWGLNGAAVATVVAQGLGAVWFIHLMLKRLEVSIGGSVWAEAWSLLRLGRDVVIRAGSILIAFTVAARVAAAVGFAQIAAHQVAVQLLILLGHVADAVAVAAQALVARFLGARQWMDVVGVSRRLLAMGGLLGVLLFLLLLAGRSEVPGWFTSDPEVLGALDGVWLIVTWMQPLIMPIYVWEGVVMGASDFGYLARALSLSMLGSLLVLLLVVPLGWGLPGIWWGLVALNVIRAAALAWWGVRPKSMFRTLTAQQSASD